MNILDKKWIKIYFFMVVIIVIFSVGYFISRINKATPPIHTIRQLKIKLPEPTYSSKTSIEAALKHRRSVREYTNAPLTLKQVSQLLWAAQGITSKNGFRTAPSAGALYPLQIYLVSANVKNLSSGIYRYLPTDHALEMLVEGDLRAPLADAALEQSAVKSAAAEIVITGIYARTINKYGTRGTQFVFMEAGHASENIYLQAVSLNLGTVAVGGFDDVLVKKAMHLTANQNPLYIMPIGRMR